MKKRIYLDYNATTPIRPEIADLMGEIMVAPYNASSVHDNGREGRRIIEKARRQIAAVVEADPNNVIFNSGATEGNNTVLKHFAGQKIAVSAIEHPSVLEACPDALKIPVNENGLIDLNQLEEICKEHKPALVSCMMVNNETGIIQPIAEASMVSKRYGSFFHCDAVQAYTRIPFTLFNEGIDFLTISAHKCGGPQGVGALILGFCGETPTLIDGGGQEKKARAGTENVAGIAGFGLAAEMANKSIESNTHKLSDLKLSLENGLKSIFDKVIIIGEMVERAPNTTLFCFPRTTSETLLMALDLEGISASNGSACSSGTVQSSHVLKAMNIAPDFAQSAIRISFGYQTTQNDIDMFLEIFRKITSRLN